MSPDRREAGDLEIHDVSSWILRAGVLSSAAVMLLGLVVSLLRDRPDVERMGSLGFTADYRGLLLAAFRGDGVALIESGILLLVLTPILRVASSLAIFAALERDWLYASVTSLVLALTLVSLLLLR